MKKIVFAIIMIALVFVGFCQNPNQKDSVIYTERFILSNGDSVVTLPNIDIRNASPYITPDGAMGINSIDLHYKGITLSVVGEYDFLSKGIEIHSVCIHVPEVEIRHLFPKTGGYYHFACGPTACYDNEVNQKLRDELNLIFLKLIAENTNWVNSWETGTEKLIGKFVVPTKK